MADEIKACEWTNGGEEVLIVRCMSMDGKTSSKRIKDGVAVDSKPFQNPLIVGETVTATDWTDKAECGGGIHGWPWALSLGDGKDCDWQGLWQVYGVKPSDIIDLQGKCKFRTGILRFSGNWWEATNFVLSGQIALVQKRARGSALATGDNGSASATGVRGSASATGWSGSASATGASGSSSATGESSASVVTGVNGKARAGKFGCIALAWWNEKENRQEMRCATTGDRKGDLKPETWYQLDTKGKFEEKK